MIKKLLLLACAIVVLFTGCEIAKTFQNAISLKNCNYAYRSITDVSITNIKAKDLDLSNTLSAIQIGKIITLLNNASTTIPLQFNINLDVQNPNTQEASFENMQYIISIDNIEFTKGELAKPFSVQGGQTKPLSINIGLDIMKLMNADSKSAVVNIVKNFIGINDQPTKVTVQLKPTIKVGKTPIASPNYIPINFSFGGKQKS